MIGGEDRQQSRGSRFLRSTLGRPAEPLSPTAVAPEADVSDGHRRPLAPPRAIAKGETSPKIPGIQRIAHEDWGCDLAGASHQSGLPAAQNRASRAVPAPPNGRRHAPRLHSDGLFSGRTRAAPWRLLRVALWKRSHGQAETWWHSGVAAELAGQGVAAGVRRTQAAPRGPGPGACGASAELAGRAGARAAAPPPGAGLVSNVCIRQKKRMSFRKVSIIIWVLAVVLFLLVLHHNFLSLSSLLRNDVTDSGILGLQPIDFATDVHQHHPVNGRQEEIPVVIAASEDRLGGTIAAINSVHRNTRSNVIFYIVTLNSTADHLRSWLNSVSLRSIRYKIVNFDTKLLEGKVKEDPDQGESMKPLTFARFYLPILVPSVKKAIYMDDDVIVQGDILALYNTPLKPGHAAAFSEDCDSASTKVIIRGAGNQYNYIGYLDYKKERIRKLSMKASTCSFNPGVFVANLTEWKRQNVTNQLEKWMKLNVEEGLYSRTLAGSITTPPLLIVFYQQHSTIDPMWNVRHLGSSAGKRYSPQFVKAAKLLHWNGHFKPWGRAASYADVWEKWYVPDPTGKFSLIRRHMDASNIK